MFDHEGATDWSPYKYFLWEHKVTEATTCISVLQNQNQSYKPYLTPKDVERKKDDHEYYFDADLFYFVKPKTDHLMENLSY